MSTEWMSLHQESGPSRWKFYVLAYPGLVQSLYSLPYSSLDMSEYRLPSNCLGLSGAPAIQDILPRDMLTGALAGLTM